MSVVQIRVGTDNFSYVIYCSNTKKAALVDPSYDATAAIEFLEKNELDLLYLINTHLHSDHTGDNNRVLKKYSCKIITSSAAGAHELRGDHMRVEDGQEVDVGDVKLKFLHTPGHTKDGLSILVNNQAIITGDTLFIGDCGRTDSLDGNIAQMFQSLNEKIKPLPDKLIVYPGHDYGDKPNDTLGNQKRTNKTLLAKDLEEFSKIP